jgi:hypothetical protein
VASSNSGGNVNACIQRHTRALYTSPCHKGDKKTSWSKVGPRGPRGLRGPRGPRGLRGPQGPGATKLVYNARGSSSTTYAKIGRIGPWSLTGNCFANAGTTKLNINISGPEVRLDGFYILGNTGGSPENATPLSGDTGGPITNAPLLTPAPSSSSSTTSETSVVHFLWLGSTGASYETFGTMSATGGTSGTGANTCHFSVVVTPVS